MIAVEQQAKERLDKLSSQHKINPVDMTRLPILQQTTDTNGLLEIPQNNSVFVAQVPNSVINKTSSATEPDSDQSSNNSLQVEVQIEGNKKMDTPPPLIRRDEPLSMQSFGKQNNRADLHYNGHAATESTQWDINGPHPHREVAVDVPDGFVGQSKVPPRYPTPQRNHKTPQDYASVNHSDNARSGSANSATAEQMERIRMYQEDLRKRKEEEERYAKEQEFLRNSLRGSEKLKALMKK